jgi:hypothetical protein
VPRLRFLVRAVCTISGVVVRYCWSEAAQRPVFSRPLREYGIDKSILAFKMPSTSQSKRSAAGRLQRMLGALASELSAYGLPNDDTAFQEECRLVSVCSCS